MARDQYQTVKEVADRLKVSEATVRGWIRHGDLRAIGKGWRIADSDLKIFLQAHATVLRHAHPGAAGDDASATASPDGCS